MLRSEDLEKLERYKKQQSTRLEDDVVESLFMNGEENDDLKAILRKEWNEVSDETSQEEVNLDSILDKIHHIIRLNESSKEKKLPRKLVLIYMKVAAILLFPLLLSGLFVYNFLGKNTGRLAGSDVTTTIYAPLGSRVAFSLPDSTSGMLNSGSHLTYKMPFVKNRKITLDGEAWLEVKHDAKHPFEISAGASRVRVLGTSLNVSAYPSENYIEVVLKKGKVEFCDDQKSQKVEMLPSERLVYHDGKIEKSITDPSKFNAWTEGKLVFREDLMAEVVRRIERWYNVKIILADKQLENYSFRATFLDDSLEDVLHYLSLTSPIRYTITPRVQLPDGTFSKELVTIYLK